MHSEPELPAGPDPFWERLAEVVAWCSRRADAADPAGSLRTPALKSQGSLEDRLRHVALGRLAVLGRSWRRTLDPLGGGRLIQWFPDLPHTGGTAAAVTKGLFDVDDAPPWDSWVAVVRDDQVARASSYVLAWIPPAFVTMAGTGVAVAGGGSLGWWEELPGELRTFLGR